MVLNLFQEMVQKSGERREGGFKKEGGFKLAAIKKEGGFNGQGPRRPRAA